MADAPPPVLIRGGTVFDGSGQRPGLRADVLVVPHHGSAKQEPTFLKAVAAPIALVQVGEHNDYGHPADTTLRQLRATGSTVFRTDLQGALAVSTDGSRVVTQR